jgi:hypothetical protein
MYNQHQFVGKWESFDARGLFLLLCLLTNKEKGQKSGLYTNGLSIAVIN